MKLKPAHLAGLVLAGATAATVALLPFIGGTPSPELPVTAPNEEPVQTDAAPAPVAVTPSGGGSLGLVREANAPPVRDPAVCVHASDGGFVEPPTLEALLACQEGARRGRKLDDTYVEFQRAEVRGYLSRHPERASTEDPAALPKSR